MGNNAITIRGVTKRFGEDKIAVDELDLVVPEGSLCGFLGPNGAGKTTTIRMVMSIFPPDGGEIEVLGKTALDAKDRIGYLPEERGVYRKMRVAEFLQYVATLKNVPTAIAKERIKHWLERVGLGAEIRKRCEELSKGMQQKVQFLASILHEPELIILDEPFSGLDPVNARLLRTLIDELHQEGRTIIFSTHVLGSAEEICDRVFMIHQGRKMLDGGVDAVRDRFDPKTIVIEPIAGDVGRDSLLDSLRGVDGVREVHSLGDRSGSVEAHLTDGTDPRSIMGRVLESENVRGVRLRKASLQDIFISLVEPGEGEESLRASLGSESAQEVTANA
ncbi:MAG: ABC transporter ATP-binding protein [Planctomycetota bacterium]|jgi:ABC-2 type transport system ATP-binding protein